MKCLRKYQWVKLPRDIPDMGKGLMAYWAMLASRAAFRKGNASYCGHSNPVAPGMWAGGVVGLKSILGVRSRTKALQILGELSSLGFLKYSLDSQTKKLTYEITDWVVKCSGAECMSGTVYASTGYGFLCLPRNITQRLANAKRVFDEADAWLDLWCHTTYEDYGNAFSFLAPVVQYGRFGSVLTLETLGERWGWEKTKVWRFFKKHGDVFSLYRLPSSYGCLVFNASYPTGADIQLPEQEIVMRILRKILICSAYKCKGGSENLRVNHMVAWYSRAVILSQQMLWQLFRAFGGPITEAENPWHLLVRSSVYGLLIGYAKPIFSLCLNIARAPYTTLMELSMTAEDFTFAGVEQTLTNGLLTIVSAATVVGLILILILEIALGWNYFKLLLETVERYIVVGVLCYTSPLAFSMGGSKTTSTVFKSWCRMVGSQLLLLVMNVWFLRGFASSMGQFIANGGALTTGKGSIFLWMFCALAYLKCAQRFDSYLASIGLNVAQTGSSMGMELMMAARVISGAGSSVRSAGSVFGRGGNAAATGTGAAANGFASGFASRFSPNSYVRDAVVEGGSRMGFNGGAGFVGRAFGGIAARNGATLNGNSISSVAARAPSTSGTIAGDIADRSLGNYMPQMQGFQLQGTQITGGHISTTAVSADGKSASVDMFNASQFEKPEVPHSVVTAADGSQWYQMASGEGRGAFYDVPTFHGVGADIPNTAAGDGVSGASQPGESGQSFGETLTHDGVEGHPGMVTYPGAADGIGAADTPAPESTLLTGVAASPVGGGDQPPIGYGNGAPSVDTVYGNAPEAQHFGAAYAGGFGESPQNGAQFADHGENVGQGFYSEAPLVAATFPSAPEGTSLRTVGDGVIEASSPDGGNTLWYNSAYYQEPDAPHSVMQSSNGVDWYAMQQQGNIPQFEAGEAAAAYNQAAFQNFMPGYDLPVSQVDGTHRQDGYFEVRHEDGSGTKFYDIARYAAPRGDYQVFEDSRGSQWYAIQGNAAVDRKPVYENGKPVYDNGKLRTTNVETIRYKQTPTRFAEPEKRGDIERKPPKRKM